MELERILFMAVVAVAVKVMVVIQFMVETEVMELLPLVMGETENFHPEAVELQVLELETLVMVEMDI